MRLEHAFVLRLWIWEFSLFYQDTKGFLQVVGLEITIIEVWDYLAANVRYRSVLEW